MFSLFENLLSSIYIYTYIYIDIYYILYILYSIIYIWIYWISIYNLQYNMIQYTTYIYIYIYIYINLCWITVSNCLLFYSYVDSWLRRLKSTIFMGLNFTNFCNDFYENLFSGNWPSLRNLQNLISAKIHSFQVKKAIGESSVNYLGAM